MSGNSRPPQNILDKIAACERLGDPNRNSNPHEATLAREKANKLRSKWKFTGAIEEKIQDDIINDFHEVFKRYERTYKQSNHRKKKDKVPDTTFVAGFRYYDGPRVIGEMKKGDYLILKRNSSNRFDTNALAVFWNEHMVGYIPKRKNRLLSHLIDNRHHFSARVYRLNRDAEPWEALEIEIYRTSPETLCPLCIDHRKHKSYARSKIY
jgi:hypothetical protein